MIIHHVISDALGTLARTIGKENFRHLSLECVELGKVCTCTYRGTPLKGHLSTADTCNITDSSEYPEYISLDSLKNRHPTSLVRIMDKSCHCGVRFSGVPL